MKLEEQIRILSISQPKQGSFLSAIGFPITFVIDIDRFAKLYTTISVDSVFNAQSKLEERMEVFAQAFSAEYNITSKRETISEFTPAYLYTCTFSNVQLKSFIDTLILNGIRARLILSLKPLAEWIISFSIQSDQEIVSFLKPFFRDIHKLRPRAFKKLDQTINPKILSIFTIPVLPGIDEIEEPILQIPSKYTLEVENSITAGKIVHPLTGEAIVDALLPIQRINQHVAVMATTGAGKTNLCYQLILELHNKVPILIFDWKRDYRPLHKMIDAKVYSFTSDNLFTFNPLKPSGDPSQWVKEVANIMAEVISGGVYASGSYSVYVELLDNLYRTSGVYEGSTNYPTIFDMLNILEQYSQSRLSDRQRNWVASASKLFKSLSIGKTRDAFGVKEGLSLDQLLTENVVIELDGLGDQTAKAFLISVLLQKIRNYRLGKIDRNTLKHVILIEEAQNCLASTKEATSTITTTYREIRGLCEGIISVTQMPSELSKDAIANTNTFFVMRLIHRDDKLFACNLLGIPPQDMNIIENLDVGVSLMKTDDICMVNIPWIEKPDVYDSDITTTVPTKEDVSTRYSTRTDVTNRTENLRPREWLFLKYIGESTAYNNTTLMKEAHCSNTDTNKTIGVLIGKGFVRYKMVKKRGGGRRQKIYFLFPYGEEAYRQKHGTYPDRVRTKLIPHYSHTEMKQQVIQHIGKPTLPGGRFDIIIKDDNENWPIEIETGSNNNQQININIEKSIETYGRVYFVASEQRIYYAILQQCARYQYEKKKEFTLHISPYNEFLETGEWNVFEYITY